ncbi:MAG TPA: hypothetical protein VKU44_00295, partial [Terriglobia bacterium]|nr:hypothetical protein [Terriglobia bacterium]
ETSTTFAKAGIEVGWVDCPLADWQTRDYPACAPTLGLTDFVLNLLPEPMARRAKFADTTFGFACVSADGGRPFLAAVFWDRVERASRDQSIAAYQILGAAMAHEIGHLLLGSMSHSRTGLMRANWGPPELETVARGCLLFTLEQCRQMRAASLARMGQEEELGARRMELAERVR